jgi:hypothetical protein
MDHTTSDLDCRELHESQRPAESFAWGCNVQGRRTSPTRSHDSRGCSGTQLILEHLRVKDDQITRHDCKRGRGIDEILTNLAIRHTQAGIYITDPDFMPLLARRSSRWTLRGQFGLRGCSLWAMPMI